MTNRYKRPCLEIEYDPHALTHPGCCRFVPIVVRLCAIPIAQKVTTLVTFDRVRTCDQQGTPLDDYELHPTRTLLVHKDFSGYEEYAVQLLARGHAVETGTIRVLMSSSVGGVLSQAEYRLDSRQTRPVQRECKGFLSTRLLPSLRSQEERDALRGRYPAFVTSTAGQEQAPEQVLMTPLFPLE